MDEDAPVSGNRLPVANWLRGYSSIQLKSMQLEDPHISEVLVRLIEQKGKPTWDEITLSNRSIKKIIALWDTLRLREGVLFRVFKKSDVLVSSNRLSSRGA